jgi:hypothetical protein
LEVLMRFSGKKKGKGFSSFAGGSRRGAPESHVPGGSGPKIPGVPGIPGLSQGGGSPIPQQQPRERLYGKKAPAKRGPWPLIIILVVAAVVAACLIVAVLTSGGQTGP